VSPNACVVLHERDLSLVLDVTDGHLPAVVHWGARIEDLSAEDAALLVRAGIVPTAPNGVDDPMRLAVLPEHWSGWVGRPGVSGSRSGVAWSPKFTTTALRVDGAEVPADQALVNRAGPVMVSVDAVDQVAELELSVDVDGEFVANIRADGLIVASPTGSTAYSLSAGGPIMHPAIAGWILVPIASHTLSNRPIVLPDRGEVHIGVVGGKDVSANFDMQSVTSLLHGDQVRVRRSAFKVRFLHPRGWSYYATLRRKLRWYEGVT